MLDVRLRQYDDITGRDVRRRASVTPGGAVLRIVGGR